MPTTTLIRLGRGPKGRQTVVGHFPHNANQRYILARGPGGELITVPLAPLNGSTLEAPALFCNPVPAPANDTPLLQYNGPALLEGQTITVTAAHVSGIVGGGLSVNELPGDTEVHAPVNFTAGTVQWQWTVGAGEPGFHMLATSTLENTGCYDLTVDIAPVPPALALDFDFLVAPSLTDKVAGVTLSNIRTGGSYYDAAGLLIQAAPNEARFDHDPETLAPLGLLIEPVGSNRGRQSQDMSEGVYNAVGGSVVVPNFATAPDGTMTANEYTAGTSNFGGVLRQDIGYSAFVRYSLSYFIKKINYRYIGLRMTNNGAVGNQYNFFDFDTEAVDNTNKPTFPLQFQKLPGGWYRLWVDATTEAAPDQITDVAIVESDGNAAFTPAGTEKVLVWGLQQEEGAMSSYTQALAAPGARTADLPAVADVTWLNPPQGVFYIEASRSDVDSSEASQYALQVDDASVQNRFLLNNTDDATDLSAGSIDSGGVSQFAESGGSAWLNGEAHKWAFYFDGVDARAAYDGVLGTLDVSITVPVAVSTLRLGSAHDATLNWFGHIRNAQYYREKDGGTGDADQFIIDLTTAAAVLVAGAQVLMAGAETLTAVI